MTWIALIAVAVVVVLQSLIGAAEMWLWPRLPLYKRIERLAFTQIEATKAAPIVANAGLYNLFIAAGLAWSLYDHAPETTIFFLSFVVIAGLYGAATLKWTTIPAQTVPAAVALFLVWSSLTPGA